MINVAELEPGTKLRLKGGTTVEVAENPGDGQWLSVRPIAVGDDSEPAEEDLVHADQIIEIIKKAD